MTDDQGQRNGKSESLMKAKAREIPVMVTYAGGYALKVEDTVTIHSNTVVAAAEVFQVAAK